MGQNRIEKMVDEEMYLIVCYTLNIFVDALSNSCGERTNLLKRYVDQL